MIEASALPAPDDTPPSHNGRSTAPHQSATYPKATFTLSSPLKLPASALNGRVVHTSVTGVFVIHAASRRLTVPLEMRLSSSAIDAVGSLTFPWSEFSMTAPSVGGFVNVAGTATTEFDLRLQRA